MESKSEAERAAEEYAGIPMENHYDTRRDGFLAGYAAAQPKWIPASERLPEEDIPVLTARCIRGRWFYEVDLIQDGVFTQDDPDFEIEYWTLPTPPKAEGEK